MVNKAMSSAETNSDEINDIDVVHTYTSEVKIATCDDTGLAKVFILNEA